MDWTFVRKAWDKWISTSIGSSGEKAQALFPLFVVEWVQIILDSMNRLRQ